MARSRYSATAVIGGKLVPWVDRSVDPNDDPDFFDGIPYVEHVVAIGERLDHVAAEHYGDDRYYWVIAVANRIAFPLDVAVGTVLRVPQDVQQAIKKLLP